MIKAGDRLYIMSHAYHHFICEVVEMLGQTRASVTKVRRVYSSTLPWGRFFSTPLSKTESKYEVFPDGELTWFAAFVWPHEIAEEK